MCMYIYVYMMYLMFFTTSLGTNYAKTSVFHEYILVFKKLQQIFFLLSVIMLCTYMFSCTCTSTQVYHISAVGRHDMDSDTESHSSMTSHFPLLGHFGGRQDITKTKLPCLYKFKNVKYSQDPVTQLSGKSIKEN